MGTTKMGYIWSRWVVVKIMVPIKVLLGLCWGYMGDNEKMETTIMGYMGDCQNYGPFLGPYFNTGPNVGDPKRDHNFDNPPVGF